MISLVCVLLDDRNKLKGDVFLAEVRPDDNICKLKQTILEEIPAYLRAPTPADLLLWKPNDNLALDTFPMTLQSWRLDHKSLKEATQKATCLSPGSTVQAEFHLPLPSDCIHLLVQLLTRERGGFNTYNPQQTEVLVLGKRKRVDPDEAPHIIELWRSKHTKTRLPTLAELATIAECPLSEEEKIPLLEGFMEMLISHPSEIDEVCTAKDVAVLFRSSDRPSPLFLFYFSVSLAPPPSGTKENYHSFWDRNIRDFVEIIIREGKTQRNSNQNAATKGLRPDFAFLLNSFCPFRGEERASDDSDDPKAELAQNFQWAYDPAPYVLGYYATGPNLTLAAICRPEPGAVQPVIYDIASADLRHRKQRILHLRRMINLTGVIRALARIVRHPIPEFQLLQRDYSTIEIVSHAVIKTYKNPKTVAHLQYIYALLKEKNVPNVDRPVCFDDKIVILSPRGITNQPKTKTELLGALECVLEMLQVIHASSLFHRDIRWPNVIRCLDDNNKWFVIDWEEAERSPTHARPRFCRETHSPRIFVDGHGAEVDIWGVGGLILQCRPVNVSQELQDLGKWMQQMPAPSAEEALSKVRHHLESAHQ